jgi:hypothetical protein
VQAGEHVGGVLLGCEGKGEEKCKRRDKKTAYGGHAKAPVGLRIGKGLGRSAALRG